MTHDVRQILEEIVPRSNAPLFSSEHELLKKFRQAIIDILADGAELVVGRKGFTNWHEAEVGHEIGQDIIAIRLKPRPIEARVPIKEIVAQLREVSKAFESNNCIDWNGPGELADRIEKYGVVK